MCVSVCTRAPHLPTHPTGVRYAAANEAVIIAEDDLMMASASVSNLRAHICQALSGAPATADMVYLEYCLEDCSKTQPLRSAHFRLARAVEPSCSAAIFFSARGAKRVSELCSPVNDVIDRMYPNLISKGWLEAYIMTPPALFQDRYFRSNMKRREVEALQERTHGIREDAPFCHAFSERLSVSSRTGVVPFESCETRQLGVILPQANPQQVLERLFLFELGLGHSPDDADASISTSRDRADSRNCAASIFDDTRRAPPAADADEDGEVPVDMDVWLRYPLPLAWRSKWGNLTSGHLVFSAENEDTTFAAVGSSPLPPPRCGVLLRIGADSKCYLRKMTTGEDGAQDEGAEGQETCELEVSLVSEAGVLVDGMLLMVFLSPPSRFLEPIGRPEPDSARYTSSVHRGAAGADKGM